MNAKKNLTHNYLYNLFNQSLVSLMPLITAPYVSRILGVVNIGHYSFVQSITSYFSMFAVLGTTLYGQKKIAQYHGKRSEYSEIFWNIFALRLILTFLVFTIYCVFFVRGSNEKLLYLAVALEIVSVIFDVSWFFQGIEEFSIITTCSAFSKLIGMTCIFLFVRSAKDVVLYALFNSCSLLLGYLYLWKFVFKRVDKVSYIKLHPLKGIKESALLFISQIAVQVYTVLDKTMIGLITNSDTQNGYYEQGQKLIRVLTALVTAVGVVMSSRIANLWINGQKKVIQTMIEHSFRLAYAISFPIMYGVILVASRFVPIFYGKGYDGVIPLLYILAFLMPIVASSNVIGIQYFIPTSQEKYLTLSVSAGATVNVMCNAILIPKYGAKGAAVGSVIAECCVTFIQFWIVRKQLQLCEFRKLALRYSVLALPMFMIGGMVNRILPSGFIGMVALIVIGVFAYLITLWIAKDSFLKDFIKGEIL